MIPLPPLPRVDQTPGPNWLRYLEALDAALREAQAQIADHESRIEALEP